MRKPAISPDECNLVRVRCCKTVRRAGFGVRGG